MAGKRKGRPPEEPLNRAKLYIFIYSRGGWRMSGREANGWGECVWCGETLKPEDKDPHSDRCEFGLKWNALVQLVIKRKLNAKDKMSKAKKEENVKALEHWSNKGAAYRKIHQLMIEMLQVKRTKVWGETY